MLLASRRHRLHQARVDRRIAVKILAKRTVNEVIHEPCRRHKPVRIHRVDLIIQLAIKCPRAAPDICDLISRFRPHDQIHALTVELSRKRLRRKQVVAELFGRFVFPGADIRLHEADLKMRRQRIDAVDLRDAQPPVNKADHDISDCQPPKLAVHAHAKSKTAHHEHTAHVIQQDIDDHDEH